MEYRYMLDKTAVNIVFGSLESKVSMSPAVGDLPKVVIDAAYAIELLMQSIPAERYLSREY